jgi:phage terminase large subunit-like protein
MPDWSTACRDWPERLKSGQSIIPPPIFPEQAEQALEIFKALKIVDAGDLTFGESCEQWVFDLVASVFGAYDAESGRRLITEWFVCLPKKNSKSTLAAGIMMTALILNWRPSAEFAILAPTIEIANNSYGPAKDMCAERADEELAALMHAQAHLKTITNQDSNAVLKVVAADSQTVGGKKSVGTLVDELWLFGKQPNAANMLREAIGGLASRPEGFVIYLTTQSDDPPAGVFKQKLDYARGVRDGRIEDRKFVPIIYEFPPDMVKAGEHRDIKNFPLVNPNWGKSVDAEFIEREYKKAQEAGEDEIRGFLAKHGNVEIGLAMASNRWAGADFWERQALGRFTLEDLIARSEVATVGIDGGGLDDLFGLCVLGRERGTGRWLAWCKAWAHPSVLERRKSEAARFHDFEKDGDLSIVSRVRDDIEEVAALVWQVADAGLLEREDDNKAAIGVDANGLGDTLEALAEAGIDADQVIGISQGWRLMAAIQTTERRLAGGELWHAGTPLMNWCVGNAKTVPKGNAVMIDKQVSGRGKIDPLMAMFNAVELMSRVPAGSGRSFWEAEEATAA